MKTNILLLVSLAAVAYSAPLATCNYSGSTSPSQISGSLSCLGSNSSISGSFSGNYSGSVASGFTNAPALTSATFFPVTGNIEGVQIEGAQPFVSSGNPSFFSLATDFVVGAAGTYTANYVLTLNLTGYTPGTNGNGSPLVTLVQTMNATGAITVADAGAGIRTVTFANNLNFAAPSTGVPEPTTSALFAAGAGVIVFFRKRLTGN